MDRSPRSNLDDIRVRLTRAAFERGVAAVRFTGVSLDMRERERMSAAFARGDFATWNYDESYARAATDPQRLLPGARSVMCIAVPYATPPPASRALRGRVSNYAWSRDYHQRMRALLADLAALLDAEAGGPVTAIACDTQPIAERAFAAQAGLGWIGKHTNLILPGAGSFVFLGEIVTTLAFAPDAPLRKQCGQCTRCVDICPTGALRGDYTIDATRCISDLTQRRDGIPRAMRPLIGDWVWGCDLCQLICPPTKRAGTTEDSQHAPLDDERATPSLVELLRVRGGTFKREYRPTAMGWRGAAVLRRNAAVALGNALDRSTVAVLADAMRDDAHPMVRGHAAWALGRIGSPEAIRCLHEHLAREGDASVREEISAALEPFARCEALGTA